jgi:hypothetical protein
VWGVCVRVGVFVWDEWLCVGSDCVRVGCLCGEWLCVRVVACA